ncbi:MAG: flagellar biosynthesis anti-sigma factor FlgM [Desulfotignum sp.]
MKIPSSITNYINTSYANQANPAATNIQPKNARQTTEPKSDQIDLSEKTRKLQQISRAMETEPADRTQLVSDIRAQVQTNQYTINAEQIAEKMIGSIMNDLVG